MTAMPEKKLKPVKPGNYNKPPGSAPAPPNSARTKRPVKGPRPW
jgi:hypothetical protein